MPRVNLPNKCERRRARPDFERRAAEVLGQQRSVALYCRSGHRSKQAAAQLTRKGYTVYELSTGWMGWVEARPPPPPR